MEGKEYRELSVFPRRFCYETKTSLKIKIYFKNQGYTVHFLQGEKFFSPDLLISTWRNFHWKNTPTLSLLAYSPGKELFFGLTYLGKGVDDAQINHFVSPIFTCASLGERFILVLVSI